MYFNTLLNNQIIYSMTFLGATFQHLSETFWLYTSGGFQWLLLVNDIFVHITAYIATMIGLPSSTKHLSTALDLWTTPTREEKRLFYCCPMVQTHYSLHCLLAKLEQFICNVSKHYYAMPLIFFHKNKCIGEWVILFVYIFHQREPNVS